LQASGNPRQTLDAYTQSLGTSESIRFRPLNASAPHDTPIEVRTAVGRVPHWFIELLTIPKIGAAFPVFVEGKRAGDIVFSPDMSSEIYEKWIAFLAIIFASILLTLLTAIIAYFTVGTALKPLEDLADGLTRMRNGNFSRA